jgi:hypothetical protein
MSDQDREQLVRHAAELLSQADEKERAFRWAANRVAAKSIDDLSKLPELRAANELHGKVHFIRDLAGQIAKSLKCVDRPLESNRFATGGSGHSSIH